MNARLQVMLESRQIEAQPAADAEVAAMWGKAVRTLRSAGVDGLDTDSAATLFYQSALQGAMTVVRAADYRIRGEGHHHHTFAAVAALVDGAPARAARTLNVIRQQRHGAVYDWETRTGDRELREMREAARTFLHAARPWLLARRPGIGPALLPLP
jgi:hypothetical protein